MGAYSPVTLTKEQYETIIKVIRDGSSFFRPNERLANILICEANLGIRIGDILKLTPSSFVLDGGRWRLDIVEEKTGKKRKFTVPLLLKQHLDIYCLKRGILPNERIFPIKRRAVYNVLEKVTNYLGYKNISTHSFRRFFATNIYESSGKDILIVQEILQHSSPICTRKYIGISPQRIEDALVANVNLVSGY